VSELTKHSNLQEGSEMETTMCMSVQGLRHYPLSLAEGLHAPKVTAVIEEMLNYLTMI